MTGRLSSANPGRMVIPGQEVLYAADRLGLSEGFLNTRYDAVLIALGEVTMADKRTNSKFRCTVFIRFVYVIVIALGVTHGTAGQQVHGTRLLSLQFLSGRWSTETPAERQEEIWSPVYGDSRTGSFRIVQHGRAVFYEFWAMEVDQAQPVMNLKHFNAGLFAWEEKNVSTKLTLISSSAHDAVFAESDGNVSIHYHRTGDRLTCTVHHVLKGQASDETFVLNKAVD